MTDVAFNYSDDAKLVLGTMFGLGIIDGVSFHMKESRPTARMQAVLDELVAEGALTSETINMAGGKKYKSVLSKEQLRPYLTWARKNSKRKDMRWNISEPIV